MNYRDSVAWQSVLAQLPKVVPVILLLAMLTTLSLNGWQFWQLHQAAEKAPARPQRSIQEEFTEQDYTTLLSEAFLFGQYSKEQKLPAKVETVAAPVTNLNLELTAVFFQGATDSVAMIAKGRSPAKMYSLNDSVEPGIVVKAIEPEAVTIQREGRLEKVVFKRFSESPSSNAATVSRARQPTRFNPPAPAFLKNNQTSGKKSG